MPSRPFRRPSAFASFVPPALLLALAPGCRDGGAGQSLEAQAAALEASFPGRSAAVLRTGTGFSPTMTGFAAVADDAPGPRARSRRARGLSRRRGLGSGPAVSLELPAEASEALVFRAGGAPVSVREIGAHGEARAVEQAVGYARAGGVSFWSTVACAGGAAPVSGPCGAEEWLRFEPGAVQTGAPAATWEIAGATLAERGDAIEVIGGDPGAGGAVRLRVTAPAAFAEGGAPVAVRLRVVGATIQLFVDAGGRGVLVDPKWMSVAPMPGPLEYAVAAVLGDGRVLVAGGDDGTVSASPTTYRYDPMADAWKSEPDMTNPREEHTATAVKGGFVLVAGGENGGSSLQDADLFDPVSETWTNSTMPSEHSGHTATLLEDGTVLIAGGQGSGTCGGTFTLNNVDLFDPALGLGGTWSSTAPLNDARYFHAAVRLNDGTVLVSGGYGDQSPLSDSEIYDPTQKTWTFTTGSMNTARLDHTAALLPDGTVLVAGGDGAEKAFASAEIYDPATQTWTTTTPMASPRSYHQMVTISGGQVMVVGGDDGVQTLATTEIFDPKTKTWSPGPLLTEARETFAMTTFGNTVLAAGGWDGVQSDVTATAELIVFGLADGSACQTGSVCSSGFCTEGVCCNSACTGVCSACTAKLKGTGMDGACGPVESGTDPLDQCTDQGASTCGTNGLCNGNGACGGYADGTVCLTTTECIVAVCASGVCGGPHELDGSPCTGGVCVAGACVKDPTLGGSSSSGGGGGGTTAASSGGAGGGASTQGAGGGGEGGQSASAQLSGSGCNAGSRAPSGGAAVSLMLALLGALRRRRGGAR